MRNLCAEGAIVHEKNIEILHIMHHKFFESVRKVKLGGVVRTIPDFWHLLVASESTPHAVVDAYVREDVPLGLRQLSAKRPP